MGAGNQIGRRTEPTAEQLLAAERRVAQRPATPFAQSLQAAFHRRLRKCSLSVLRDELVTAESLTVPDRIDKARNRQASYKHRTAEC